MDVKYGLCEWEIRSGLKCLVRFLKCGCGDDKRIKWTDRVSSEGIIIWVKENETLLN